MRYQRGYIKIVLVVFALIIGIMMFPLKFPIQVEKTVETPEHYCRDLVTDPNAPIVEAPSYDTNQVLLDTKRDYKLIKQKVLIHKALFVDHVGEHFFKDYKQPYTDASGKTFIIRIPKGEQGRSYKLPSELGNENFLQFSEYGLIYLFYSDDGIEPKVTDKIDIGGDEPLEAVTVDIYKAVDTPDLPEWVLKCFDVGLTPAGQTGDGTGKVILPSQSKSEFKDQLQLEWFLLNNSTLQLQAWWTPHCKPAVYLYPKQKQMVNVQVKPLGELGYTDPLYPENGWTVTAFPSGKLKILDFGFKIYDYLYYESKLLDSEIRKPNYGWTVRPREMEGLFNKVLPKLGLNEKEALDFKEYWLKTLPESPYYFVGLVEKDERDRLEKLVVTPRPDTSIRFSLYFEPLDNPVPVPEPVIKTPKREGFTLVDWGGMIKLNKNTPFTCSQ